MKFPGRNPLSLAALVLVLIGLLLPAAAWLGLRSNRRNLERMFYSKGSALLESVLHSAESSLLADREIVGSLVDHLADDARYLLLLDRQGRLDRPTLEAMRVAAGLVRLELHRSGGRPGVSTASADSCSPPLELDRMELYYREEGYETFSAFLPLAAPDSAADSPPALELLAVAVRGPDSSLAAAFTDAGELVKLRRRLGIGLILDDLSAVEGVVYAVLQDTLGIIAASSQVVSLRAIRDDPFFPISGGEIRARYQDYFGREVYELAEPLYLEGEHYGYLRVALATDELRAIAQGDRRRFLLGLAVLMVLLAVVAALYDHGRRQLALEREHQRVRTMAGGVLEGMDEAVIVLDEQDRVVLVNQACRRVCPCPGGDITGRELAAINPALARLTEKLDRGRLTVLESELPGPAGPVPVLLTATPLAAAGERLFTLLIRDLTDRKQAERLALLGEKYKTMAEVSAGVAHEIRNPLNAIGMNVQRLKLEFNPPPEQAPEYEEFIGIILAEVSRLNRIVEQFLTLARFPGPHPVAGRIEELLGETAAFVEGELAARGVRLEREIQPGPVFPFDPGQLRQVLLNLLRNAAESMDSGGRITLAGAPAGAVYRIAVADGGPGIPETARARLFEPFFSTKPGGMGLGLAIVQRIVSEHGGAVRVESAPGRGSCFTVELPLAPPGRPQPGPSRAES